MARRRNKKSIDECIKEAKELGITYAEYQQKETLGLLKSQKEKVENEKLLQRLQKPIS